MKQLVVLCLSLVMMSGLWANAPEVGAKSESHIIVIETNMGNIVIQLDPEAAPKTVANFQSYIDDGFYDGVIFHRVINNFMIQAGGFDAQMNRQIVKTAVGNESLNGLSNVRGSIAMARTNNPHSATSQFFINQKDNTFLDGKKGKFGYTVFGQVIEGMDIVDLIAGVKTTRKKNMSDVPVQPIVIHSIHNQSESMMDQFYNKLLSL